MEPDDCEAMYRWENDTSLWTFGDVTRPFSRAVLRDFIADASLDIYHARQLRLVIEPLSWPEAVGCVDLFAFDPPAIQKAAHEKSAISSTPWSILPLCSLNFMFIFGFNHYRQYIRSVRRDIRRTFVETQTGNRIGL